MPKRKPSDLVFDQAKLQATQPAKSLEQQLEEELVTLRPIPEEEVPSVLAATNLFVRYIWDALKRLKPGDLNPDQEMTVEELSDFLPEKPAVQTIYGWVSEERIPYIKRGKRLFFVRRAIIRWNREPPRQPGQHSGTGRKLRGQPSSGTKQAIAMYQEEPHFSFFRAPVRNVIPYKQISLLDTWRYITGHYARRRTEELRQIRDPKYARMYKAAKFDYCTFSGTFSVRREDKLIRHSGLLCLDFDHLPDVEGLFPELLQDEYFDTMLLFRSPSGDGLKWIIPTDLTECSHADFFRSVSAYIAETYRVSVDSSGKDVCRACFLPYDPGAYLSPDFSQAL